MPYRPRHALEEHAALLVPKCIVPGCPGGLSCPASLSSRHHMHVSERLIDHKRRERRREKHSWANGLVIYKSQNANHYIPQPLHCGMVGPLHCTDIRLLYLSQKCTIFPRKSLTNCLNQNDTCTSKLGTLSQWLECVTLHVQCYPHEPAWH